MVVVGSTMLQSGISGSTVADVSAMSAMTLKPLENEGYPRPYSLSVIGASCAFSIPHPALHPDGGRGSRPYLGGRRVRGGRGAGRRHRPDVLRPSHIQARLQNMPRGEAYSFVAILKGLKDALFALGVPILIFGGIRMGIATGYRIAVVCIRCWWRAGLSPAELAWHYQALVDLRITGVICLLMGFAMIFGYLLATEGVPGAVAQWIRDNHISPWGVMLITALIFVFIGAVLEGAPAVLIFVPILLPVVRELGIDVVHWLTVVVLASGIGLFVPPTGWRCWWHAAWAGQHAGHHPPLIPLEAARTKTKIYSHGNTSRYGDR